MELISAAGSTGKAFQISRVFLPSYTLSLMSFSDLHPTMSYPSPNFAKRLSERPPFSVPAGGGHRQVPTKAYDDHISCPLLEVLP